MGALLSFLWQAFRGSGQARDAEGLDAEDEDEDEDEEEEEL
jgi:hypothetical protein